MIKLYQQEIKQETMLLPKGNFQNESCRVSDDANDVSTFETDHNTESEDEELKKETINH